MYNHSDPRQRDQQARQKNGRSEESAQSTESLYCGWLQDETQHEDCHDPNLSMILSSVWSMEFERPRDEIVWRVNGQLEIAFTNSQLWYHGAEISCGYLVVHRRGVWLLQYNVRRFSDDFSMATQVDTGQT